MDLFEMITGRVGESYERSYVWARSESRALQAFRERFPLRPEPRECVLILSSGDNEFVTEFDDSGFGERVFMEAE